MSVRMVLDGLDELITELGKQPKEIRDRGLVIVREETEGAAEELRQHYPEASRTVHGTGTLRSRVRTFYPSTTILTGIVQSMAPHAHLWHWGTKVRQTDRGANRGRMPKPNPEPLVPIARRRRLSMNRRLADMLRGLGYVVTGV
jgi:hypothetical protein